MIFFFINCLSYTPITCANDSNDLASISEANRQNTAANLAKAIKPLLGFDVSKITGDDAARVYKSHLCVLKRDLMLAVIFSRLFGYPIRISPQSSVNSNKKPYK
jgi:hypothetical protein